MALTNPTNLIDVQRLSEFKAKMIQAVEGFALKGSYKVVNLTSDITAAETPAAGSEIDVLYVNNTNAEHIVTISAQTYRTSTGENLQLVIPAGWYGEASFLNISNTIYVRGM